MIPDRLKHSWLALACAAMATSACAPPDAPGGEREAPAYLRVLEAEDARPSSGRDLATLVEATKSVDVFLRQAGVRALGRLENPDLVPAIAALLDDPLAPVRAEAANALAQAVHRGDREAVLDRLLERAEVEDDPLAQAALARSVGRSATTRRGRARASASLVRMSRAPDGGDAPLSTLLGVALGLESLARGAREEGLSGEAVARLVELGGYNTVGVLRDASAPVRALAYSALAQSRRLDRQLATRAMRDADPEVRAVVPRHLDLLMPAQRPELVRRLLVDESGQVVVPTLLTVAREPRTSGYCGYLYAMTERAPLPASRLLAIDALSRPCPDVAQQRALLLSLVRELDSARPEEWRLPARALLALARLSPLEARDALGGFARHENPFARAHAARAAGLVDDRATLRALARDADANVRTAALSALFALDGHEIDDLLLAQLGDDDPQLLMTVARLLEGAPERAMVAADLLDAFDRISTARRETWRDARRALLARASELGGPSLTDRLRPYLADYDAAVATDVAGILTSWDGRPRTASPQPLPRAAVPTAAEYRNLRDTRVVLHMRGGGAIVIDLMASSATTNVFRFVRLAESGYFDGLTFHRWAPGFVIQGGSPGANEYQGDGPYSRDEVGLPVHWRGTVGISTRGRDTGDAQIFVNLAHNVRLDHDYTVVGTVVEGMDVVDAVLEGSVIERAEVLVGR